MAVNLCRRRDIHNQLGKEAVVLVRDFLTEFVEIGRSTLNVQAHSVPGIWDRGESEASTSILLLLIGPEWTQCGQLPQLPATMA